MHLKQEKRAQRELLLFWEVINLANDGVHFFLPLCEVRSLVVVLVDEEPQKLCEVYFRFDKERKVVKTKLLLWESIITKKFVKVFHGQVAFASAVHPLKVLHGTVGATCI